MAKAKKEEMIKPDKLSKYERARVIGSRALQLSMGAPYLVKLSKKDLEELKYNPLEIAKKEFAAGVIPIDVLRKSPETTEKAEPKSDAKSEGEAEDA